MRNEKNANNGNAKYVPQIGDMIRVSRVFYNHVGIYAGARGFDGRCVVHNDKNGGVVFSTLAEFSGGAPVHLHKAATGNYHERMEIADRAFSLIGQKFNLVKFNCEHAATWSQTGKMESPQLEGYVFLCLLAILGLAFAVAND